MTSESVLDWRRRGLHLAGLYVAGIISFVVLLTAVYALPQAPIEANLRESLTRLQYEGPYAVVMVEHPAFLLDNYTDALMADTALADSADTAFIAAMAAKHSVAGTGSPIDGLRSTLARADVARDSYAYYWHGYQVLLRPALEFMTLGEIRQANVISFGLLLLGTLLFMHRRVGTRITALFAISLLAVGVYVVPLSLQFSGMFYLTLAATLAAVALRARGRLPAVEIELFFAVGMLAAFIDLLTTPLLTFALPLVVLLAADVRRASGPGLAAAGLRMLRTGTAWSAGYVASWVTKWIIAGAVLDYDVVGRAWNQVLLRTAMDDGPPLAGQALGFALSDLVPFAPLSNQPLKAAGLVAVVALLACGAAFVFALARTRGEATEHVRRASAVLLVTPLPYLWLAIAANHTVNHHYFAYRIQAPAIFAVLFFIAAALWPGRPVAPASPVAGDRSGQMERRLQQG
ncbi:MAG: hypothetical protein ACYCXZ_09730 [Coriobacteriia bacterium]